MTAKTLWTSALSLALVGALGGALLAEKVDLSPEQLRTTATHVVTGKVTAIYQRVKTEGRWQYTHYAAEVKIEKVEKGTGLDVGTPVYVRYWKRSFRGNGRDMPVGTSGHRGLPTEGQRLRVYVARNAYDGFTDKNTDGGYNVIGANGFETLK